MRQVILKEYVEPIEERREHKRMSMTVSLYLSYLYWRVIKPIFTK